MPTKEMDHHWYIATIRRTTSTVRKKLFELLDIHNNGQILLDILGHTLVDRQNFFYLHLENPPTQCGVFLDSCDVLIDI